MTKEELSQLVELLCKFVATLSADGDSATETAEIIEKALSSDNWSQ